MKRLAVLVTSVFLALSPSQAKTSDVVQATPYQTRSVLKTRMQTKSVLVRAVPKHQRKFLATNILLIDDEDNGPAGPDELDLHTLFRRPKVVDTPVDDADVSDYVRIRLEVARARAMEKYRQTWV
jgi:hypothetical protein